MEAACFFHAFDTYIPNHIMSHAKRQQPSAALSPTLDFDILKFIEWNNKKYTKTKLKFIQFIWF
jgi:hypothetical protein